MARAKRAEKVFSHAPILNRSATALCSARALSVSFFFLNYNTTSKTKMHVGNKSLTYSRVARMRKRMVG